MEFKDYKIEEIVEELSKLTKITPQLKYDITHYLKPIPTKYIELFYKEWEKGEPKYYDYYYSCIIENGKTKMFWYRRKGE